MNSVDALHSPGKWSDDITSFSSVVNGFSEPVSSDATNVTDFKEICETILSKEIRNTGIRIWDLSIIIPNALFLLFLILRCNRARMKLRTTNSPIFSTFYVLVALNAVVSVVRCVVAMTVNATMPVGDVTDKVLWVLTRFFLLATEISVLVFGLAFGHLDSHTSVRRVLIVTPCISFFYSVLQGVLEMTDIGLSVKVKGKGVFAHGGMIFCFVSSLLFGLVYLTVLILPWTRLRERLALPSKQSFYWYILFLDLLNVSQAVGCLLRYYGNREGLCVVDTTAYIYFTIFTPLVYRTFLAEFFSVSQPIIMFSYKAQVDDVVEDDNVSLPHQLSCSSLKTDSDYIYQNNSLYDSTHFDAANINPLYIHSLQSPDSFTGFESQSVTGSINASPPPQPAPSNQQKQQTSAPSADLPTSCS